MPNIFGIKNVAIILVLAMLALGGQYTYFHLKLTEDQVTVNKLNTQVANLNTSVEDWKSQFKSEQFKEQKDLSQIALDESNLNTLQAQYNSDVESCDKQITTLKNSIESLNRIDTAITNYSNANPQLNLKAPLPDAFIDILNMEITK